MNEFSDRMPLFFELNFSTICQKRTNTTTRNYIKWETNKNDEYAQILQPHREKLLSVVNNITSDVDIHNAVREITRIIYDSAFKVFGQSVSIHKSIDRQNRPNNEWFDENCKNARKRFHVTTKFFIRHQTDANRSEYVIARNSYNKVKRKAQYNYKRKKGLELCSIAKTNQKKFWSTLKSKCVVDNEEMFNYFENVWSNDEDGEFYFFFRFERNENVRNNTFSVRQVPVIDGNQMGQISITFFKDLLIDGLDQLSMEK
ncbi:unnamed protein product [Mytilus coruscus]|uniref:Uncharacterized protein n=1 Tax=Mytilus coruscus TaxID=42192 RepID=A0A6J8DAE2_MYTCO|nr:unnamed protein product [Mytilus coruscus]